MANTEPQVALVHEWLAERAGSEILFEQIAQVFPSADLYALTTSPDTDFDFGGRPVRTTWLNRTAATRNRRDLTLPLMPLAWKSLRRPSYDLVISSTHGFGREFVKKHDGKHFNYVHAPMRYAWTPELDGRADRGGFFGRQAMAVLKHLDNRSVDSVDSFAANSTAVAKRIRKYYDRDAQVIYPPVDTDFFEQVEPRDDGYLLAASRFIPYKRHDLAIEVAARLDMPIVVAGSGAEEPRLRDLAARIHPSGTTFEIHPSRERLRDLMAGASAFIFPAHEDFGIIVPEVQATGTPVVALAAGGTLDTVDPKSSGTLATEQSVEAFTAATHSCIGSQFSAEGCRQNAKCFSKGSFDNSIVAWIDTYEGR